MSKDETNKPKIRPLIAAKERGAGGLELHSPNTCLPTDEPLLRTICSCRGRPRPRPLRAAVNDGRREPRPHAEARASLHLWRQCVALRAGLRR